MSLLDKAKTKANHKKIEIGVEELELGKALLNGEITIPQALFALGKENKYAGGSYAYRLLRMVLEVYRRKPNI